MVCADTEERKAMEIERAFSNSPHNGETFELYCRIPLLRRCQPLQAAMFSTGIINIDMTEGITQAMQTQGISKENDIL